MKATSPSSQRISSNIGDLVNYYQMAYNLHTLQKLKWVMEISLDEDAGTQIQDICPPRL